MMLTSTVVGEAAPAVPSRAETPAAATSARRGEVATIVAARPAEHESGARLYNSAGGLDSQLDAFRRRSATGGHLTALMKQQLGGSLQEYLLVQSHGALLLHHLPEPPLPLCLRIQLPCGCPPAV